MPNVSLKTKIRTWVLNFCEKIEEISPKFFLNVDEQKMTRKLGKEKTVSLRLFI